jgi:hypothetical protein
MIIERVRSRKPMLMWLLPVMLLLAPFLGTPTNAEGASSKIYACVNPSGLTRIVGAPGNCHPSEKSVQWDPAGSPGGALTVIDSRSQTLGPLISPNAVSLTVNEDRFFVGVTPNGFFSLTGATFYYANANCSGSPLLPPSTDVLFPYLRVVGTTGYYASLASVAQEIQVASYKTYSNGVPPACTDAPWMGKVMMVPPTSLDLSAFTPPFSVTVK